MNAPQLCNRNKRELAFVVEAIVKSSDANAAKVISVFSPPADEHGWPHLSARIRSMEKHQILDCLQQIISACETCKKICEAELNFDCHAESYKEIIELFEPGWQEVEPEGVLKKILDFSEDFGVPRVKLRLLIQFTNYADVWLDEEIGSLAKAHEEIERTLEKMPKDTLKIADGAWFYAQGVADIREFMEDWGD